MSFSSTTESSGSPGRSELVSLNGTNIYYEVYGEGEPLLLLHGFTQSSASWLPYVADFANDHAVYLIDLKGHGKSDPFTAPLSIKAAAADLEALINHLDLRSVSAIGYSYGGDILFQLALLSPGLIRSMIVVGACGTWVAKKFPEFMDYLSYANMDNLPCLFGQQVSEEQIKAILDQVPNYDVRLSDKELKSIAAKTLMIIGDNDDSLHWSDILNAKKMLPNASLWVVPDAGHGAHKDHHKDEFVRVAQNFLRREQRAVSNDEAENMKTVTKAVEAVNARDFKTVSQCLTDHFVRHDLTDVFPATKKGSGEAVNFLQELIKAIPDLHLVIQDISSDKDRVVIRYTFSGQHQGPFLGFEPTGKKVSFSGINIYRFENRLIAEVWQLWDWSGVLRQIGALDL